jgi:acyl-CoA reductase-like NAD-dependent aldehyde dehydrogenase
MLIGGELVGSSTGEWMDIINPANEEIIGRAPVGGAEDVAQAVAAAEAAWPKWAALSPAARAETLHRFADRIQGIAEELLEIEVTDTGNTITPMRNDAKWAVQSLRYYAGLAYELKGQTIPGDTGTIHMTFHEPYGVVARIIPFNHPLMFAVSRTAAALVAGNAVVVKPSETSPISALRLAEIAREVFPAGVFNIVTGAGPAGDALVRHPLVKRIAFIGSTMTGRAIQRAAAETGVKHVTLELGGKNAMIICPDADIETAARSAVAGMNFGWAGQSCGSTSRLLLHEDIHDAVLARVTEIVANLRILDPMDSQSQIGPVNSSAQHSKTERYIEIAKNDGARLVNGGARPGGKQFERGFWVQPTVFADVDPGMRIAQEEVFGPILSVMRWRTEEDAASIANSTEYGLTGSVFTNDLNRALRLTRAVRSGFQWVNGFSAHYCGVPFGGYKGSGTGTEEGIEELYSYTERKTINIANPAI